MKMIYKDSNKGLQTIFVKGGLKSSKKSAKVKDYDTHKEKKGDASQRLLFRVNLIINQ